jgi:uncharacterized protein YjbI with pentapeptide repeats
MKPHWLALCCLLASRRAVRMEKRRLVRQIGSPDNAVAVEAARMLRARGWGFGEDITLHKADLRGANLRGANLIGANLHEADLKEARLQLAFLVGAALQRADLRGANLQGADLKEARLRGANLIGADLYAVRFLEADLQGAFLVEAALQGADLRGANLGGANLEDASLHWAKLHTEAMGEERLGYARARFDEETILPDRSRWTPGTDMSRFTRPWHPDFWYSDNPRSPAYQGGGAGQRTIPRLRRSQSVKERQALLDDLRAGDLLRGVPLSRADLRGAHLEGADLGRAHLGQVNLQGAQLSGASLQEACLWRANLLGAHLEQANLQGADLREADLQGADLQRANLQGADLEGANLQGAVLEGAGFDEETILPSYPSRWTPDTDLTHFTDPDHPSFWRSNNPASPAFRGWEYNHDTEGDVS